jgi:hypothetical protein
MSWNTFWLQNLSKEIIHCYLLICSYEFVLFFKSLCSSMVWNIVQKRILYTLVLWNRIFKFFIWWLILAFMFHFHVCYFFCLFKFHDSFGQLIYPFSFLLQINFLFWSWLDFILIFYSFISFQHFDSFFRTTFNQSSSCHLDFE